MREQLKKIKEEALTALESVKNETSLEELRVKYLGKKGDLTALLRQMGSLSAEERPVIGQLVNEIKASIEAQLEKKGETLAAAALAANLEKESIDVTLPGKEPKLGGLHPITLARKEIEEFFIGMGFQIEDGPEVETGYYNFEALNIPKNHPARDIQDTFYISDDMVLRTATSPMQIRVMEKQKPPIRIVSIGKVYRSDAIDATHSPMFHQIEGLVVDKGITLANLKGTLEVFAKRIYGEKVVARLRPHYFPFTEPSAEMDIQCFACKGAGCRVCKGEGWIELLGCGMVHPKVLAGCGIDPDEYSGFAFGMGLDRITMKRFNIDDLRLLFENDVRFLKQFS